MSDRELSRVGTSAQFQEEMMSEELNVEVKSERVQTVSMVTGFRFENLSDSNLFKMTRTEIVTCLLHFKNWNSEFEQLGLNDLKSNSCALDDWILDFDLVLF